ncbi:MAG: UDP-N-acetylmuramoyl-tripeptide--D-alanyl-D-alanine ligase [Candidatus Zixiibacteriota bacterium]|nr:MAG: UDP-N-acetylmuramoyl-tripeptide--D-alanyl-D-alanine ligase [candidate division Zixibacteria bacterium]
MKTMVENKDMMFTVGEIGEILGARMEGTPEFRRAPISGVKIDSRLVGSGDLFIAIRGEKHDGHDYVHSAFANGAAAAVVSREIAPGRDFTGNNVFMVEDTVYALGQIAKYYRSKMTAEVIAVTGSNGKTTVKNLVYEVISRKASTIKSQRNYNNFFGLPLSIFQIKDETDYAVFELGMSRRGEISRLGEISLPDVAVITNVGPVHLEFFNNLEDIASAKLEIIDRIKSGGVLIVNGDDDFLREVKTDRNLKIIKFGLSYNNDIYPADLEFGENQLPRFKINGTDFKLAFPGVHNVYNAVAAFSVAVAEGIDSLTAAEAISGFQPEGMRSQVFRKSGILFFVDCYNANPVSMKYAIDTLALMKCDGRRIAVLGDMLELGNGSELFHREVGKHAKKAEIDQVMAYGELSGHLIAEFGKNGEHFGDKMKLYSRLKNLVKKGDLVLFKGSRGMALEEIAEKLMKAV